MGDLLPRDALRHVFAKLNGRTLCCCAGVCRFWQEVADEDALWHQVILTEFYRPNLLAYTAAWLHAGWRDAEGSAISLAFAAARAALHDHEPPTAATSTDEQAYAAPSRIETQQEQQHEGSQEHGRQKSAADVCQDVSQGSRGLLGSSSPKPGLKALCFAGMLHSAAPHQALLARFHAALQHITGWRVVVTANTPAPPHDPEADADVSNAAQADTDSAAAGNPTTGQPPEHPSAEPQQHSTQAAAAGPSLASTSARDSPSSSNCSSSRRPVAGYPAALTMQALLSGGWAVGCVEMQQQEQSCWVRFNLPRELVRTPAVMQALHRRELVVTLQGLGPCGWFDVATCDKFELSEEEMEILMQSHRSGFYAWDQADEGWVDSHGQLEPLPWDVAPGAAQQQQQQQQVPTTAQELADSVTGQEQLHPLPQSPVQQQQQQEEEEMDFGEPEPQLRMLVYVHYEQLLQVLPFAVPQVLPLPPAPVFNNTLDFSRHLVGDDCSLWLQLDVCQLHGGFKLGTCVVPLALNHWSEFRAHFLCKPNEVLVALYDPGSSLNSTQGLGGQEAPAATLAAADVGAAGARSTAAGTSAAAAAGMPHSIFGQEACIQVLLGDACLYGEGHCSEDGMVVSSADDALHALMTRDEIMVDFALFDAQGHLLMGRAGVEVWSREVTSLGIVPQHVAAVQPRLPGTQPPSPRPQRKGKNPSLLALQLESLEASIGALGWDASLSIQQRQSAKAAAALRELTALHIEELQDAAVGDDPGVHANDETTLLTRSVQKLHFLVDGGPSRFWETFITIDAERLSPAHTIVRKGPVSLHMPWSNVRPMFGLPPFTRSA